MPLAACRQEYAKRSWRDLALALPALFEHGEG
jgi:hypothetical protein